MGFIETLITAITAGHTLTVATIRSLVEDGWLAGLGLLVLGLFMSLHHHAPMLFWAIVLLLFFPISLMLFWSVSAP